MSSSTDSGIYSKHSPVLDRYVQIGVASSRLVHVSFPEEIHDPIEGEDHPVIVRIERYLDRSETTPFSDIEIALTVPTERRAVLEAVRTIPYGQERDLKFIISSANLDPDSDQDVSMGRSALSENPLPLVIPDHRIADVDGALPVDVRETFRSIEGLQ